MLSKKELFDSSKITLHIDDYTGIFSDFDPRPYSKKALSDDFLIEAKRAAKDRPDEDLELIFLIPKKKRRNNIEIEVKKRLKQHFKKHFGILQKEKNSIRNKGIFFIAIGVLLMLIASFILFKIVEKSFFINFLIILLEPAGWFLFWEGSNLIIFEAKKQDPDLDFYKKMAKVNIKFMNY
jgi:hypothetical protein